MKEAEASDEVKSERISAAFPMSGGRPGARYVSATTVREEALERGRWIGLYWSASGQAQRENVTAGLPGIDSLHHPLHAFELEIDGQSLHNRWEWIGAFERAVPSERESIVESVVELRHRVRPVTVRVVTRLDGSPFLVRALEITNAGDSPAALASVAPWSGVLWSTPTDRPGHIEHVNPSFDSRLGSPADGYGRGPSPFEDGGFGRSFPALDARGRSPFSLGYFASEDWGGEGDFSWQPLSRETFRIERTTHGRTWGPPYFIVRNEATGEMFFLGLAWGGNFFAEFSRRAGSLLSFRVGPAGPAPLRILAPGETTRSPEVHLGPFHGAFDDAVASWHQHVRASVARPRPDDKRMFTIAARVVEEPGEWIGGEIDIAAEMGVEAFMVDAGWYGAEFRSWPDQRGDWFEGDWLPGGIAGLRERARGKGMLFGLWHEAEALSRASRLFREHPDWLLRTDDGRDCSETLDLANPDAARFFEETVLRLIRDHHLDFYKIDYNVAPGEGGQSLREGYAESEFWRHHEAFYRTFDHVAREHPDVCLENCAGGGGRNDLGTIARFHYSCESDWSIFPYSIRAINGLTLFLPPEAIVYYHNHIAQAHQTADLDTHLRVTLFAAPIFVGFGAQDADRSTEYFAKTKRYIGLHKGFCRPVLAGHPRVYHHTPDIGLFAPAEWCVLEYAAPDRSRGYAGVFRLGADGDGVRVFRPRGVDPSSDYFVALDSQVQAIDRERSNGADSPDRRIVAEEIALRPESPALQEVGARVSGYDLMNAGIRIRLDAPLTSELILYERARR